MTQMIIGMALFFGAHLVPNIGDTRNTVIAKIGEKAYMAIYALVSVLGIVLLVNGRADIGYVSLWSTPEWGRHATLVLMAASLFYFVAIFLPTNAKRRFHHPMLAFVGLWGAAHLFSNGDLSSLLLFGSMLAFSLFKILSLSRRKPAEPKPAVSIFRDLLVVAIAAGVYGALLFLHPLIAGVPLI